MSKKKKAAMTQAEFNTTIKGIIAILVTLLFVAIALMLTARSMFVLNENNVQTILGKITSTEPTVYVAPEPDDDNSDGSSTTSKATTSETTTTLPAGATEMRCASAVYLHPSPSSDSENLLVIPQGALVTVYRNESGWYYLDYNGQQGYAYSTFFESNE